MRRTGVLAALLIVAAAGLAVLGGLFRKPVDSARFDVRFTLISSLMGDYWEEIARGAQEEARRQGVSLKCVGFEKGSTEKTVAQIDYAISAGVDGLILSGGTRQPEVLDAMTRAQERGIPVVFTDAYDGVARPNAIVASDSGKAGRLAAQILAEATGGEANVLIVVYNKASLTQKGRMQGFEQALADYPGMRVVGVMEAQGDAYNLQKQIEQTLADHPEINAIFSAGASASEALGRLPVLRERLGDSIRLVAFDLSESIAAYIEEGLYDATIVQMPRQMGETAIAALMDCRRGEAMSQRMFYTELVVVTRENLSKYATQEGGAVEWNVY